MNIKRYIRPEKNIIDNYNFLTKDGSVVFESHEYQIYIIWETPYGQKKGSLKSVSSKYAPLPIGQWVAHLDVFKKIVNA